MSVSGCVHAFKITSSFIALRMSSHLTCSVSFWLFDAQRAWLCSSNLLFSWRSLYWLYASRHAGCSQPPTSWVVLIDRLIDKSLANRSPRESIPVRPRQSVVYGKCNTGRWQIFMATWQQSIIPKVEVNTFQKRWMMVRFLICIKLFINLVFLCKMNLIWWSKCHLS